MASVALSPRLTLVRQIGQGAMGEIWLAEDSVLACQVAVKLVAGHLRLDARTLERFQQEARGAARISSPHTVRVLDHGVIEGRPYIVMELLRGEDLGALLRRVGVLAPAECARIVEQACRGLASVHEGGLVHRDVKPDNMFLVDDGGRSFVKLLDFGLAAEVRAKVTAASGGSIVGTPCYMSPEHTEGMRALVPQSDMWSLGVVAYEALTGALPFEGDGLIALAIAIADARFEPPSVHRPELPPALDAFFQRVFARSPEDRFDDANAMARAFTHAVGLAPEVVTTASFAAPPRTTPPARRRVALAAAASALAVAGAMVVLRSPAASTTSSAPPESVASAAVVTPDPASAVSRPAATDATDATGAMDATVPSASSIASTAHEAVPPPAPRGHLPPAVASASARPIASVMVISLPPSARPADSSVTSAPRRERGF